MKTAQMAVVRAVYIKTKVADSLLAKATMAVRVAL
jgi:hypothetical protein